MAKKKKTLILSQKQLDEIVGGNSAYLDNIDNDFAEDGSNEVYTGEKLEDKDSLPLTTNTHAKERCIDYGPWMPGGKGGARLVYPNTNGMVCCSKKEWKDKVLNETNQNLVGNTYGDSENRVSNTNASTLKWRYGAAKKKAQSNDPTIRQQGISTMKTMEKNNPNLQQIETQYNAAMANDANIKQTRKNSGESNVFQKEGGTKTTGNGGKHTEKNEPIITYEY